MATIDTNELRIKVVEAQRLGLLQQLTDAQVEVAQLKLRFNEDQAVIQELRKQLSELHGPAGAPDPASN